jgi:adenine-specific DNA-methyltransferase
VNRIVEDTIGPVINGKTPKQVEKIKILDPACGSGSFLLGAYEFLLRWHLDYYFENKEKYKNVIYQNSSKSWCLTPQEKKKILLNNIYGVDIDAQAVETTKLSLCLKVLEGETKETLEKQLTLFKEQALPDIGENIKCGNSLVGSDIGAKSLSMNELYKINPFDWKNEFKSIFSEGKSGFDVIIGNPPYLRVQGLNEFHGNEIAYYSSKYQSAVKRFDMYLLFIERSYQLMNKNGVLGFICPHKFINSDFGSGIRSFFHENKSIYKLISFDYNLIFQSASTYTCLLYLTKEKNKHLRFIQLPELKEGAIKKFLATVEEKDYSLIDYKNLNENKWVLSSGSSINLLDKLYSSKKFKRLDYFFEGVVQGIVTGNDDTHLLEYVKENRGGLTECYSPALEKNILIESNLIKKCLVGKDVKRFDLSKETTYCIFPYKQVGKKTIILEEKEFKERFPKGYDYIKQFKVDLTKKKIKYKTNAKYWYSLHRSRDIDLYEQDRIITPEISFHCNFRLAVKGTYHNAKVYSLVPSAKNKMSSYFWLGILNSNFSWWYMCQTGYVLRGGYSSFSNKYLNGLPLPVISSSEKELCEKISSVSNSLENLTTRHAEISSPTDQKFLERQLISAEKKLNELVYELYGFSKEEILYIERTMRKESAAA